MKAAMVFLIVFLRVLVANAIVTKRESNVAKRESNVAMFNSGVEPALAPMPAPAPKSKQAFAIDFEIHNLNYMDLSKEVCQCKTKMLNGNADTQNEAEHPHKRKDVVDQIVNKVDGFGDRINGVFQKAASGVKDAANQVKDTASDAANSVTNFLQVKPAGKGKVKCTNCTTVMNIMKKTVEEAVRDVIHCTFQSGALSISHAPTPIAANAIPYQIANLVPTPAPPSAAFLQNSATDGKTMQPQMMVSGPAPGPQIAAINAATPTVDPAQELEIFVTFAPGKSVGSAKSTKVDIAFAEKLDDHVHHHILDLLPELIHTAMNSGMFTEKMDSFVAAAIGIHPQIVNIEAAMKQIDLWPIAQCKKHIKELVGHFSVHYTREQVPRALYNECTNFMTKISFSHDYVLDPADTTRCQKATALFTKQWEYGKNVDPEDFQSMCVGACKAKFGKHALQCSDEQ